MSEIAVVPDVARAAAELFVEAAAGAVAARGKAAVALTGGSTACAAKPRTSTAKPAALPAKCAMRSALRRGWI